MTIVVTRTEARREAREEPEYHKLESLRYPLTLLIISNLFLVFLRTIAHTVPVTDLSNAIRQFIRSYLAHILPNVSGLWKDSKIFVLSSPDASVAQPRAQLESLSQCHA